MASEIYDIALAESGERKIEWVKRNCPLLRSLEEEFLKTKPFVGKKIALSVHLEAKTAYLCQVLAAGGAEMFITGSNPLSTQDDVAAALVMDGLEVHAWHGCTPEEYEMHIDHVLENACNIIIDDGGDLVHALHTRFTQFLPEVIGGCEETTTGILRLKAMDRAGELKFPMVLVNDADCKHLFDNRYGTGQSTLDAIMHTTNLVIAGKKAVVAGYGWCGKGIARRLAGMGAVVFVTEVNPVRALEAVMDGFTVLPMDEAASIGDLFITVTGCKDVIVGKHFEKMKDGVLLANAGHFNVEINKDELLEQAVSCEQRKPGIEGFTMKDGRILNLLADGRLVNLAAGNGHPAEIMDMSFALQAKCLEYLVKNPGLAHKLYAVPVETDMTVAEMKLSKTSVSIDKLTDEQKEYLGI